GAALPSFPVISLEFAGAQLSRHLVENAIDERRLVAAEEAAGDAEIFFVRQFCRRINARHEFIGRRAHQAEEDNLQPLGRAVLFQPPGDQRVDLRLPLARVDDDIAKQRLVAVLELVAVELRADAVLEKFLHHLFGRPLVMLKLIERLHGIEPRQRASAVFIAPLFAALIHRGNIPNFSFSFNIWSAASAAPPPLFFSDLRARAQACASFSQVMMPLPTAIEDWMERSIRPRALSSETVS